MAGWTRTVVAPAKLTLTLRVLGTRPDGFHELEALTALVSAPADTLLLADAPAGRVELSVTGGGADVPHGDDNLVVRAARAVLPTGAGLRVALAKVTPSGAGLGGGSADAAAVLRVLRDRFGLDRRDVLTAAAALGSDVPVCVEGRPVMMRGRGEVLDPVQLAGDVHVVIAKPAVMLATPPVFRTWDDLGGPIARRAVEPPPAVAHLVDALANDLEPAAEAVEPGLVAFREAFARVAGGEPLLAGSGSSYWVPVGDPETATFLAARVRDELGVETFAGRVLRELPGDAEERGAG
jgi:4-diphosphocytidyl-2-C-methyl-D-erythritol kinase